jgi:cytochrome c553
MQSKISVILAILFLVSCATKDDDKNEQTKSEIKVTNPNGMSEMSLIMEEWYNSMKIISDELKAGHKVEEVPTINQDGIFSAKTSKPNVHGNEYNAFVETYFYNYNQLKKSGSLQQQTNDFNLTVTSCVNCHEQFCHGPIVRIKKLAVKVE